MKGLIRRALAHWLPSSILALASGWCVVVPAAEFGDVPPGGFRSPEGDRRFSSQAGVHPINNLVFELLNATSLGRIVHRFRNPRTGWVHMRVPATAGQSSITVRLDSQPVSLKPVGRFLESMRYLELGPHTVEVIQRPESVSRFEVRAIGELVYATYGGNPHVRETGIYTWKFLKRHCLDHYNSMIGSGQTRTDGSSVQESELREWTSQGKRWFTLHPLPLKVKTVQEAYDYWTATAGMTHPLMSGIWADEFGVGERHGRKTADLYPLWNPAIRRIHTSPKYRGRTFNAYCGSKLWPADSYRGMFPFVQMITDCDYRLGTEWYLPEGRSRPGRIIEKTGDLLAEFSPGCEGRGRESFEKAVPGSASNRVLIVGLLSEPGWESCDLYPNYNFNVFLDAQMQFIATDPAFFALRGLQGYLSSLLWRGTVEAVCPAGPPLRDRWQHDSIPDRPLRPVPHPEFRFLRRYQWLHGVCGDAVDPRREDRPWVRQTRGQVPRPKRDR